MLKDILHPSVLFLAAASLLGMPSCEPVHEENDTNALPVLSVTTPASEEVTSKEDWMKGASLSLSSSSDKTIEFNALSMSIRGRGNSTWTLPKKPYALKLDKKHGILGMPEHKRWVLIANYFDNSFIRNSIAFYLSERLEMDYTVRGDFVMLKMNGTPQGLYWLGEAIKVDKNRVDIDEDNDYLIELDEYYDEVWKFRSPKKDFPYMIKNDDAMTDERLSFLRNKIADLETQLYPEDGGAPDETYRET
ncbi:MAG: CotH kinase family protein, partial [Bacteroidales bacterium]|nr:CotH kinase family protein [Bacteroidales bacterium]